LNLLAAPGKVLGPWLQRMPGIVGWVIDPVEI